jgi:plastocyanin
VSFAGRTAAVLAALGAVACGSSFTSTTPGSGLLDPEQPRAAVPAVTISASGFAPQVLHVNYPVTVTFTNSDTTAHRLESAPDLGWDNCPELKTPVVVAPGQAAVVPFSEKDAVCGYHDVDQPTVTAFQGYIAIH